jgi:hypothetical protein
VYPSESGQGTSKSIVSICRKIDKSYIVSRLRSFTLLLREGVNVVNYQIAEIADIGRTHVRKKVHYSIIH